MAMLAFQRLQDALPRPTIAQRVAVERETEEEFNRLMAAAQTSDKIPRFYIPRKAVLPGEDRNSVTLRQRVSQAAKIRRLRRADPSHAQAEADAESQSLQPEHEWLTGPSLPASVVGSVGGGTDDTASSVYQWLLNDDELEKVWLAIESQLLALPPPPEFDAAVGGSMSQEELNGSVAAATIAMTAAGERLNYDGFLRIVPRLEQLGGARLAEQARRFFLPSVFARFTQDEHGTVSARALYHYIIRKVGLVQHRLTLSLFDLDNTGYLSPQDLEQYILSQLPVMQQFQGFREAFYPFYVATALARFFFLLDTHRTRKLSIRALIASDAFREFNEMRQAAVDDRQLITNWFSPRAALRVRAMFVNLDSDRDQALSRWELLRLSDGNLTPIFVDRLIDEYADTVSNAGPALSYHAMLEYMLAAEHRRCSLGVQYYWRIFDVEKKGRLTLATLNLFLRDINAKMASLRLEVMPIENMTNEIFDMIRPADGVHITLQDLLASNNADLFCAILTDVNAFYLYLNRENLVHQTASAGGANGTQPSFLLHFNGSGFALSPPGAGAQ